MKSFGPEKCQITSRIYKVPFWQFSTQGRDSRALVVRSSRIPCRISKNIFVLDFYEFLTILAGKIEVSAFFMVQYCKITVWSKTWKAHFLKHGYYRNYSEKRVEICKALQNIPDTPQDKLFLPRLQWLHILFFRIFL